jgi:hypothetical protein
MLVLLLILTVVFIATKPSNKPVKDPDKTPATNVSGDPVPPPEDDGVTLPLTPDAGIAYQDKIIFVGDSLTAHLINREVLTGGTSTKQVWRCENNMMNLNSEVTSAKIIYPGTGEKMTVAEAAGKARPEIMIITLGTDWGVSYLGETEFKDCYSGLIQAIQKASPKTKIILQSIFPVTAGCPSLDNTRIDTATATRAKEGLRKVTGGVLPRTRSRITPPPTAVTSPRMATPKISIFRPRPTMAPETAKATVPTISINKSTHSDIRSPQEFFPSSSSPPFLGSGRSKPSVLSFINIIFSVRRIRRISRRTE